MAANPAPTTQRPPEKGRPHPIRLLNAANTHWRTAITPIEGEPAKIGHHCANYLMAVVSWADQRFLTDALYGGVCLCLPNGMQERITGYSVSQCMRIRQALQRHGLIHVVPGKAGRGGKTSPQITILVERILDVPRTATREEIPEVGDENGPIVPERRDTHQRIAPHRGHMSPEDSPVRSTPRSFGGMRPSTRPPDTDRPTFKSNPDPYQNPSTRRQRPRSHRSKHRILRASRRRIWTSPRR